MNGNTVSEIILYAVFIASDSSSLSELSGSLSISSSPCPLLLDLLRVFLLLLGFFFGFGVFFFFLLLGFALDLDLLLDPTALPDLLPTDMVRLRRLLRGRAGEFGAGGTGAGGLGAGLGSGFPT